MYFDYFLIEKYFHLYDLNISSLISHIFIDIRVGLLFSIAGGDNGGKSDIVIRIYKYI